MQSYRELAVWQRSMRLVEAVYAASETLPRTEVYGLASQMRRLRELQPTVDPYFSLWNRSAPEAFRVSL